MKTKRPFVSVRHCLLLLCGVLFLAPTYAMQPMADEEMSGLVGREGVSLRLELLINAKADGSPMNGEFPAGLKTFFKQLEYFV